MFPGCAWLPQLRSAAGWLLLLLLLVRVPARLHAQSAPHLSIDLTPIGTVFVEWPVGDGLFQLQERPSLDAIEPWRAFHTVPEVASSVYQLELDPTNRTRFLRLQRVAQPEPGVVPSPEAVAPLPPVNALESFADSTRFLHSGPTAVQIGVAQGTISDQRASVLRGKVKKRDGAPLAGVHVRILNHPEFGFTYTRADGMFDLGVNGGPLYTVDFQSRGYCPAQRQVPAPLQDFRCLEDVILIAMDPISTPVTFGTNAPVQVAKSSMNTDKAGSRSATVLFPPGTCATLVMPDGTTQDCRGLTIRATEFTVGPNGPQAMPGPLPPTSAYTYAVELSGDEAVAAGISTIRFSQFVHVYVDNFLNMPTGALMPSAYYDRQRSAWVPQENGVVIKVLDVVGGLARVDVDGDGEPENSQALADAAFTTEELRQLAANYPLGKSLWRMPITHFTAMDFNCPTNPEEKGKPNTPGDHPHRKACNDCDPIGGNVEIAQQVFHETIPLVGAPMDLHYSSARVPGYRVDAQLDFPLTGGSLFAGLTGIRVDMEIAGRLSEFDYPAEPNQTGVFFWDGLDAYGRLVGETRRAYFALAYHYPQVYGGHWALKEGRVGTIGYGPPLFGNYGQFTSTIVHNEATEALRIQFDRLFTIPDHRKLGLGGWSLTPQHRYDPVGKILYRGDGSIEQSERFVNSVSGVPFDGRQIRRIAAASDGSFFLVGADGQILRMTSAGLLTSVSGNHPFSGNALPGTVIGFRGSFTQYDGWPAAQVYFSTGCYGIAVGPDDSIYYRTEFEILRVAPDGMLHVVLGKLGVRSFDEDGTSARNSYLSGDGEGGLAVGPDGTVYFSDTWDLAGRRFDFLRKVAPDGRLYTLAGKGGRRGSEQGIFPNQPVGHGDPAINLRTDRILAVGVGPDGSVYFSDGGYTLNRITPGGILDMVLYGRPLEGSSDGQPAVGRENPAQGNANIPAVKDFKIGADGTVYIAASVSPSFLWKIDAAGNLQRLAGKRNAGYRFGSNPTEMNIGDLYDFAVDSAGGISMVTRQLGGVGNLSIQRIGPAFPGFDAPELQVASRDGGELYVFNGNGIHLRTLNTLTGTTNWLFHYDSNNLVTHIRDRDGLLTQIERTATGSPTAIVGPYGQRTVLTLDGNGFLASVVNPANEAVQLASDSKGLLQSLTTPRGNTERLAYDTLGRVVQAVDAAGNTRLWTRTGRTDSFTVNDQAPSGSVKEVKLDLLSNGDTQVARKFEDGTTNTEIYSSLGDRLLTDSDGSVTTSKNAFDPRFPAQTRVPGSLSIALPGGLTANASISRSVTLADSANPLSISNATTVATVNGSAYTSLYSASNRTEVVTTPEGGQSISILDEQGREIHNEFGGYSSTETIYDSVGRIAAVIDHLSIGPRRTDFAYDSLGRLARIVDPLGRTNSITYDPAGRPTNSVAPDGGVVSISYDAESNVTSVTPPGRPAHQFTYDALGLLTKYTPPAVGAGDDSVRYHYDAELRPTRVNLPDGQAILIAWETNSQLKQLDLGNGPSLQFKYNSTSGLLTNIMSSNGNGLSFGYQGSLVTHTTWSGAVTGNVAVQYNADFRPILQTVNGVSPINYVYDRDGLLVKAGELTLTRDPNSGAVVSTKLGVIIDKRQFNESGLLTNYTASVNGTNLWTYSLAYDALDRIIDKVELLNNTSRSFRYVYDIVGRLSQVLENGAVTAAYTYDANGNRLSRNSEIGSYDVQDRLIHYDGATYTYSPNGSRLTKTSGAKRTTYNYDLQGALASVSLPVGANIDYSMDPVGRRIG